MVTDVMVSPCSMALTTVIAPDLAKDRVLAVEPGRIDYV
jgi:hypothetical protein